jgi:hypothetical protein
MSIFAGFMKLILMCISEQPTTVFPILYIPMYIFLHCFVSELMIFSGIRNDLNNHFDHYAPYYFELDGELEVAKEASKRILAYYFRGVPIGQTSQTQLAEVNFINIIITLSYWRM